mmetsp:Transcript_38812/g.101501  ORF Transcript_38812/g.101501 Transcript_38812/m.101501 type:complete len:117 (+) Transcript_38812:513-863(+)
MCGGTPPGGVDMEFVCDREPCWRGLRRLSLWRRAGPGVLACVRGFLLVLIFVVLNVLMIGVTRRFSMVMWLLLAVLLADYLTLSTSVGGIYLDCPLDAGPALRWVQDLFGALLGAE